MKSQNLNTQILSRKEMKNVMGGDLVAMLCPICIDHPYWGHYEPKDRCVAWHCPTEAPPVVQPNHPCEPGAVC